MSLDALLVSCPLPRRPGYFDYAVQMDRQQISRVETLQLPLKVWNSSAVLLRMEIEAILQSPC